MEEEENDECHQDQGEEDEEKGGDEVVEGGRSVGARDVVSAEFSVGVCIFRTLVAFLCGWERRGEMGGWLCQ